jgi:hypothetical protein
MRKVDTNVRDLVSMIERGELRLPEMQRRYVWKAPRIRDLLDSLYRGYPSGSILVWETEAEQPTRDLAVAQQPSPFSGHKLLLDGQQRLTSLSAVLRGEPIAVRGRTRAIDILFNLDHPDTLEEFTEVEEDAEDGLDDEDGDDEEGEIDLQERLRRATFVVASKALARLPNWVSVTEVFKSSSDGVLLQKAGVTSFSDPRYAQYSARLQRLRRIGDYPYVMHVLERELSYNEIAEIFVRVNSLGAKLRGSDLALAQITARWPNSLKLMEEFQEECEESWFTFDLGLLVRTMVVFATGQSRFRSVSGVPIARFKEGWESAKAGLRFAINFLQTNADIEDESLLSSPYFFITLAYLSQTRGERLTKQEERDLLYWVLAANAKGHYSRGSSETILDADLSVISKGGAVSDLIEVARQRLGRLHFEVEDLAGRNARSPLFSTLFLALKANGAKDWQSGLGISLAHQGRLHYIQYHHIFPKSRLKDLHDTREVNEIANLAFIAGGTNRRISNKLPVAYFPDIVERRGVEALASQCVPTDSAVWELPRYREFLAARRTALTERLNAFLDQIRM